MIYSLRIENFKCFQRLDLKDLGRINVIVGESASGKTTLLESIFMPGGNPEIVPRLSNYRGSPIQPIARNRLEYELLWDDLFFNFSKDLAITINLEGTPQNRRALKINYSTPVSEKTISLLPSGPSGPLQQPDSKSESILSFLTFETTDGNGKMSSVQAIPLANGLINMSGELAKGSRVIFSSIARSPDLAKDYSALSQQNKEGEVKNIIKNIYPFISDLSIETAVGGLPALYCSINGLAKKIPVSHASSGLTNLLGFLCAIPNASDGALLIDEIENGFYYTAHEKLWDGIIDLCFKYKVQLFASTHSMECLKNILPALNRNKDEFRLIRTQNGGDIGHTAHIFKGKDFASALETNEVDVRGK